MNRFILLWSVAVTLAALTWDSTDAVCCPWVMTSDMKCTCDDGSKVAPWECCSEGACNVFCCNCGGPCKKAHPGGGGEDIDNSLESEEEASRERRSIDWDTEGENDPVSAAARHFLNIDVDGDLAISLEETVRHLNNGEGGDRGGYYVELDPAADRPDWFAQIDSNGDGVIDPREFDSDLDDERLRLEMARK